MLEFQKKIGREFRCEKRNFSTSELKAIDIRHENDFFLKRMLVLLHFDDFKEPVPALDENRYELLCSLGNPMNGNAYKKGLLFIKLHNENPTSYNDTILNFDNCGNDAKPKAKQPRSLL